MIRHTDGRWPIANVNGRSRSLKTYHCKFIHNSYECWPIKKKFTSYSPWNLKKKHEIYHSTLSRPRLKMQQDIQNLKERCNAAMIALFLKERHVNRSMRRCSNCHHTVCLKIDRTSERNVECQYTFRLYAGSHWVADEWRPQTADILATKHCSKAKQRKLRRLRDREHSLNKMYIINPSSDIQWIMKWYL